jgi:hypothetical protein
MSRTDDHNQFRRPKRVERKGRNHDKFVCKQIVKNHEYETAFATKRVRRAEWA